MKALSLSQPWCWAVVHSIFRKHIENRTWQPAIEMIGQTIAIHAAKSWDGGKQYRFVGKKWSPGYMTPIGYLLAVSAEYGHGVDPPGRKELYPTSCIVGVATIARIVTRPDTLPDDQKRWFFGPFGWVLENVRRLEEPIPASGKQGLWTIQPEHENGIQAQLPRAA